MDEFPTTAFYEALTTKTSEVVATDTTPNLLYVGRLHPEKLVADLIHMMGHLRSLGANANLVLAGDGTERRQSASLIE